MIKKHATEPGLFFPGTEFPMVILKPVRSCDIDMIAEWVTQTRVRRWLDMGGGRQVLSKLQLYSLLTSRKTCARLFSLPQQAPCGLVCLNDIDNLMGTAEAWGLRGDYSGSLANITLSAALTAFATGFFDLDREVISTWVVDSNHRSLRVHRVLGFKEVGRLRSRHLMDGQRHDRLLFDMTREEFCALYPDIPSEKGNTFRSLNSQRANNDHKETALA